MTAPIPDSEIARSGSGEVPEGTLSADVQRAGDALLNLAASSNPHLAARLARLVQVVAAEAARTQRFARALSKALEEPLEKNEVSSDHRGGAKRGNRRDPGRIDPFAVFADGGEPALRGQLELLDLEQLRDIVAEHGMDHDRLALKWKDPNRVITRIVERVTARAAKGSAFRGRRPDTSTTPAATSGDATRSS